MWHAKPVLEIGAIQFHIWQECDRSHATARLPFTALILGGLCVEFLLELGGYAQDFVETGPLTIEH